LVTVLGPQRPVAGLPVILDGLGVRGPCALITAGWRHDEARDEPIREEVKLDLRNLGLYGAFRRLEREDSELISRYTARQNAVRRLKERYRAAIVPAIAAWRALSVPKVDPCPYLDQAVANIQAIDRIFLEESDRLHAAFEAEARPGRDPQVRDEIERIHRELSECDTVLLAGGHVGVLRNRMFFFGLEQMLRGKRIIAWSGGAMVLTERIVLFHDHTTYGVGLAEILDRGAGLIPDVVFFPHARERLLLTDPVNVALMARRFAPARCVGLENGAVLAGPRLANIGEREAATVFEASGEIVPVRELHAPAA
jgi:hypothetical protein